MVRAMAGFVAYSRRSASARYVDRYTAAEAYRPAFSVAANAFQVVAVGGNGFNSHMSRALMMNWRREAFDLLVEAAKMSRSSSLSTASLSAAEVRAGISELVGLTADQGEEQPVKVKAAAISSSVEDAKRLFSQTEDCEPR